MMTSAGTHQLGFTDHGKWQLFGGRTRSQHGRFAVSPHVKGIAPGKKLTLVAGPRRRDSRYRLSSKVTDVWTAADAWRGRASSRSCGPTTSRRRPRTTSRPTGRESFPVTFDNLGPVDARVARAACRGPSTARLARRRVKRVDENTFRVSYANPAATAAHPYLSLRLKARDQAGRSLTEQVENAYVLPNGRSRDTDAAARRTATGSSRTSSAVRRARTSTAAS